MNDAARHSDAPGDAAGGVLVIGYGNTLRSDDGVGWHAASLLAVDPRLAGDVGPAGELRPAGDVGPAGDVLLAEDVPTIGDVWRPGVEVWAVHQLTPELALDFSRVSLVILIDAGADDPPGAISVQTLTPDEESGADGATPDGTGPAGDPGVSARDRRAHGAPVSGGHGRAPGASRGPGATSHHVGPAELLALARALYGAAPQAFVVRVGVADMDVGETLSPAVAAALPAVADVVVELVAAHRRSRGTRTPR